MELKQKRTPGQRRFGGILFVLLTIVLWFVFGSLAEIAITCVPGGAKCVLRDWRQLPEAAGSIDKRQAIVMLISLAAAAWASMRIFFPPEEFDATN